MSQQESAPRTGLDFIRTMVTEDIASGKHDGRVITRFPPEPNGFLHIGHVKSICLNFGLAEEYRGRCHLRFDDTNPETEDIRYVESIQNDVRWLGFDWGEHLYFASDYFEQMYAFAEHLITTGDAYVDSADEEEIRDARGTVTEPGRPTKDRSRPIAESLDLFRRMRAGEFPNGAHVLRGKIDLASKNMLLRDPIFYRIRHATHYRTGDAWCIYPLYDYAHPIEDAIEGVTHSLCTLEFDNNRALYDWVVDRLPRDPAAPFHIDPHSRPEQTEFARLALDYTVMSKRKLLQLVNDGLVSGWDDPRMPTVAGMRRRGMTPESLRAFAEMVGVAKSNSRVDIAKLEYAVREDLNVRVPRVMCVVDPLRVVITNFPEGDVEQLDTPSRSLPFTREILIDRDDFREDPPKGFHRLSPGGEVRLRHAVIIRCDEVVRNDAGEVVELRCTMDRDRGRSVKGTIHWVSATHSLPCEVRLYDRLFDVADPDAEAEERGIDWKTLINPASLVVHTDARIEPSVADDPAGSRYQFERVGYFISDIVDSRAGNLVFNRTVTLRESFTETTRKGSDGRPDRTRHDAKPGARGTPAAPPRSAALEQRMHRLIDSAGVDAAQAEIITRDAAVADLFDAAAAGGAAPAQSIANWIVNELPRVQQDRPLSELALTGGQLAALIALVERGEISSSAGRDVLAELAERGGDPAAIVERRDLRQLDDPSALAPVVRALIDEHPDRVAQYRSGRTGLLGFFVGQAMARTGGRANPQTVSELLRTHLEG